MVRRRHVIYVPGYDPRGIAEYYRMFRSEFRKFIGLYGVEGRIGKITAHTNRFSAHWSIDTKGRDWQVDTTYEFLRWEDIIRRDFRRPAWWKILHALKAVAGSVANGVYANIIRANWRFAVFMAYPFLVLLGLLLLSGLGGTAAAWIASTLVAAPTIPPLAGVAAAALVLFALIRWTERYTYMLYLFDDIASTHQFVYGDRPDWEERFEIFAGYLIDAAKSAAVDEIVVVGHSSGSFIAVEVVGRALARDPDLGRHGPQVSVLTVGANMPIVGFNPVAETFRQRLRRLAIDPDVRWIEYQSRRDVMNFYLFDPIAGHGLELGTERRNPTVMPVVFRHLVLPENYPSFRWHFFRVHFQFVMANQTPAAYDFYMMVCGPFPLPLRAAHPDEVLAAVAGDPAAAQAAWESLRFWMPAGTPPENGRKTGVEQAGDTD